MATTYKIYHETLSSALFHAKVEAFASGAIINRDELDEAYSTGGVPYGTTREAHLPIEFLKSKATKKHFHVSIYRMDSGRYELTCYIL
jgi:hypothetical protein